MPSSAKWIASITDSPYNKTIFLSGRYITTRTPRKGDRLCAAASSLSSAAVFSPPRQIRKNDYRRRADDEANIRQLSYLSRYSRVSRRVLRRGFSTIFYYFFFFTFFFLPAVCFIIHRSVVSQRGGYNIRTPMRAFFFFPLPLSVPGESCKSRFVHFPMYITPRIYFIPNKRCPRKFYRYRETEDSSVT